MNLKRYLKTDNESEYSWLAMVDRQGRYEIMGDRNGSRVLLFRGVNKETAGGHFDYLAHKHGAYSLSQPLTNYLVRT